MRRSRSCRGLGARVQAPWAGESLPISGRNLRGPCEGEVGQDRRSGDAGPQSPGEPTGSYPLRMGSWGRGLGRQGIWCTFYKSVPLEWRLGGWQETN